MAVIINPYKRGSKSARALKDALSSNGVKAFVMQKAPTNKASLIVNWGNSDFSYDPKGYQVVNHPSVLGVMTNKLKFFRAVGHNAIVPEWATSPVDAMEWGGKVVARQILEGSGGAGIVIWDPEVHNKNDFPKAPLYVKYENKTHEFRLHMARSLRNTGDFNPILVQRKIFRKGPGMEEPKSWEVRNHTNGFIYVQESGYPTPDAVVRVAKDFMNKHFPELHFAALDIIHNEKKNRTFVLEGNTAPGLEGNTIEVYGKYFKSLAKEARV